MQSWSYVSGGKVFASDESVSASDAVTRSKNGSVDWELRTPCSYRSSMVYSGQEFGELGFPELMRKSLPADSNKDVLSQKINGGRMFSSVIAIPNAFSCEDESSSKLSSSVGESNYRDSLLVDLKLGGFGDHRDPQNFSSSGTTPNLSSIESTAPTKRVRTGGLSTSTHYCQVDGCKKDLSSSKDYHKRHKVCEVHSKTAKVIVNGIEQRFCQQCSRFHLLAEFDDGKRSCRKRLAGHNERRRKPHVGGRSWKLFQKYNDMKYQGTPFAASSYFCPDMLPCDLLHSQKCDANNWSRRIKLEDNPEYFPQSVTSFTNAHLHPRFPFLSYDFGNQYSPLHDKGIKSAAAGKISESNQFPHDMASSNSVTHSFFQSTSMVSESQTIFDAASSLQGLSETSNSGCALSLLSSQLHNSSRHLPGIPMAHSLIIPCSHSHYNVIPVSDKLLGVTPQDLASGGSTKLHSSGLNSAENIHLDSFNISDDSNAVNFGVNGLLQGSEYMNAKDRFSSEVGPTVNLLQLSSQLHRVEHQRQSLVKQESDALCGLRIT